MLYCRDDVLSRVRCASVEAFAFQLHVGHGYHLRSHEAFLASQILSPAHIAEKDRCRSDRMNEMKNFLTLNSSRRALSAALKSSDTFDINFCKSFISKV